tara:strand:- start:1490 stop:1972 length:483 start_codon:yes stop_codon:yes gene_type:complete
MRRPKSCQRISNLRRRFVLARAAEKDDDDDDASSSSKLAPSTPTSAHGEMLEYILSTEPDSFEGAMESVLEKLSDEVDATKALEENNNNPKAKKDTTNTKDDAMSLTLYKRIEDIKKIDRRRAVEDAMYASIIHKVIIVSFFFFFFFGNARYSSRADNAT